MSYPLPGSWGLKPFPHRYAHTVIREAWAWTSSSCDVRGVMLGSPGSFICGFCLSIVPCFKVISLRHTLSRQGRNSRAHQEHFVFVVDKAAENTIILCRKLAASRLRLPVDDEEFRAVS